MDPLYAKGINGQITFDGATIRITREGFVGRSTHGRGEKVLAVKSIGAVQLKPATALVNGYIQFSVSGESSRQSIGFGRSRDASKDENAVVFAKKSLADFEAIRDAVLRAQAQAAPAAPDHVAQLERLAALRDAGVITDGEFETKKAELLDRI
jgi:hypothetical protein